MAKKKLNFGTGLLLGAIAGAALIYFLNDERSEQIKNKARDFSRKAANELADKLEAIKKELEE